MINQLTFTRFLAAVSIVIFHYGGEAIPFDGPIMKVLVENANIGVSYFFILSGFVMIIAYHSNNSRISYSKYYLNRFARIYPIYFLALASTTLLLFFHSGEFETKGFLLSLFLFQGWIPEYANCLNTPGWSLSVELLFYLLFPLIHNRLYRSLKFSYIVWSIILFWVVSQLVTNQLYYSDFYTGYPSESHSFIHYFPILHLNQFLIGNFIGLFYLKFNKKSNYDLAIILLSLLLLFTILLKDFLALELNIHNGFMAIFFIPFIYLLALNQGRISNFFSNKYLIILGEISYGIYILQYPVYLVVYNLGESVNLNASLLFYTYMCVLIFISYFVYKYVEIPVRFYLKQIKL